jgi:D-3-phosphoglycerate dehydrogenase
MKILISDAFDPGLPEKLKQFGEVTDDKTQFIDADIILIRSATKCKKDYLDQAKNCKYIIRGGVGLDNVDVKYAESKGIIVKNTASASAIAVAELAFAMMLAIPNRLIEAHNSTKEGKFLKNELKRTELYGKNLTVIGTGNIGIEVARRAHAFGMKVFGYDIIKPAEPVITMMPSLEEAVKNAHYISLHVPLTDTTKGMINKDLIAKMKDNVSIINAARGEVIVEEDVAEALKSGKMKAYATDVWYSDPPAPTSPILSAPNTIMAPHIGASTKENLLRIGDVVMQLLTDYVKMKK